MKKSFIVLGYVVALAVAYPSYSDDAMSSYTNKPREYRTAKTAYEQFLEGKPSKAMRLEYMRKIVRESRLGPSRADRVFHNFEGSYSIDPRIPGVEKSVLLTRSTSRSQAKGYRRELLYAVSVHNDPSYSLEAMNKPLIRSWGNTDADIVFHHKTSGLYGRIEVKDYSKSSQQTNLLKLKVQIDKMAKEARFTGQPQIWMNRRKAIPELRKYAEERGVPVFDKVSTGQSSKGNTISSREALDVIGRAAIRTSQVRTAIASGQLGFGLWMMADSMPNAWEDYQAALNQDDDSSQAWLKFGESGPKAFAGGTMAASGGSMMASRFAGAELQGSLYRIGQRSGVLTIVAIGVGEGFAIARYVNGDVSSKDFWTTQYVMGTAAGGGFLGGLGGSILGGLVTKNPYLTTLAGAAGGAAGAEAGDMVGRKTSDMYYEWKFAKLDEEFGKFVYECYGLVGGASPCLQINR